MGRATKNMAATVAWRAACTDPVPTVVFCLARQMRQSSKDSLLPFLGRAPALSGGLRCAIAPQAGGRALLTVTGHGQTFQARAAVLSVPYPSGLERLLARAPDVEVVLVERASPGLHREAEERGIGYLDLDGHGRLVGPGLVYVVPPPGRGTAAEASRQPRRAPHVSAFAPRASRVARALLGDPARAWRLSDLAEATRMNPGNVHRILGRLTALGPVERDGDRYLLTDPGSLLDAWASHGIRPKHVAEVRVTGDLWPAAHALLERLGGEGLVSGELAAERLAPYLPARSAIVHCWDPEAFHRAAAAPSALRGEGVLRLLLSDRDVGEGATDVDGLPLASPMQIYLDLHDDRGRAREAAEHLRAEVLGI